MVFLSNLGMGYGGLEEGESLGDIEMVPVGFFTGLTEEKSELFKGGNQEGAEAGQIQAGKVGTFSCPLSRWTRRFICG